MYHLNASKRTIPLSCQSAHSCRTASQQLRRLPHASLNRLRSSQLGIGLRTLSTTVESMSYRSLVTLPGVLDINEKVDFWNQVLQLERQKTKDNDEITKVVKEKRKKGGLSKLLALSSPDIPKLLAGALCLCTSSAITMSVPYLIGRIVDVVTKKSAAPLDMTPNQFFTALAGVFVLGGFANFGRVVTMKLANERITGRLRTKLYRSIMSQEIAFFDATRSSDLVSRLTLDTTVAAKTVTNNLSDGLRSLASAIVGFGMMVYISPKLSLTMMGVVPPFAVGAAMYGRRVKKLSRSTQDALSDINVTAEERISNIRTVRAFTKEEVEAQFYESQVNSILKLAKKEAYASGIFYGVAGMSGNLTVLAVLSMGGTMVLDNEISVGALSSFLIYTAYAGYSMMGLASFFAETMKGLSACTRLFQLLDRKPDNLVNGQQTIPELKGKIEFENVDFAYPTRPDNQVFKQLSFTLNAHSVLAIAGASGAGKTTIGSLLLRFYDPINGAVKIDGVDLKDLELHWWHNQIAIVSQEPVLFANTIRENIRYGKPEALDVEIEEAAKIANCGFIEEFPEGLDTYVGERGVALSGGQKQR
ncbi:ATP-binding cassette permease mdl1, variant 2 [Basidiobolus ranarum]